MSFQTRTFTSLAVVGLISVVMMSTKSFALEGSWQAGINAGISRLTPETSGSGFTLDDDQSSAVGVYVGLDITPIISAELAFTDLGEASLSNNETIEYQAISLGATAYFWGEKEADRRSKGASGYARLGFSSINNDSNLDLDESDNIALWLGVGIQYPVSDNWGLRAELTNFDGDAQSLMAGVFWRTGTSSRGNNSALTGTASLPSRPVEPAVPEPTVSQQTNPAPVQPTPQAPTPPPVPKAMIAIGADVVCPPEAAAKLTDPQACAVLNGVMPGIDFADNTAQLTPTAAVSLDRVVTALQNNPDVVLEIRAHTASLNDPQTEAQLSSLRARSVARYLVQKGVPVSQLRAKAFGSTQPITDTDTADGQRTNDRIELRIL